MSKSPSCRKAKRTTKLAKERQYQDKLAEIRRFPEIVVQDADVPASLMTAVRAAAKKLRFEHAQLVPEPFRRLFLDAQKRGFPWLWRQLCAAARGVANGPVNLHLYLVCLGELLFQELPRPIINAYLPYHCIDVHYGQPHDNTIAVAFRSLKHVKAPGGTIYFSHHRPTIRIGGQAKIVSFSDHAIQRINDRTVYDWRTYGGSGDAFACLDSCLYYEDCSEQIGGPGFTFYNFTGTVTYSQEYARQILGTVGSGTTYYYRVGYCPAVIEGEFIKAKTLLIPGMSGTPEYCLLHRASFPPAVKERMLQQVPQLTFKGLVETHDFSVLQWFHDHGISQVVTLPGTIFRHD